MNDSELIQGLRSHDPQAVRHLTDSYLPTVWRFVYGRVSQDRHLAEDIVSETVLALIKAVSDPEVDIRNPGGWLRTVAANKVTDHFRAASRVQHLIDEAQNAVPDRGDNDAVQQQELLEQRAEIREVMNDLPDQTRMALEWKYVDKVSVRDIADRLGTTEKAAESILFRGRKEFRERMTRRDSHDGDRPACRVNGNNSRAGSGHGSSGEQPANRDAEADDQDSAGTTFGHGAIDAAKVGRP